MKLSNEMIAVSVWVSVLMWVVLYDGGGEGWGVMDVVFFGIFLWVVVVMRRVYLGLRRRGLYAPPHLLAMITSMMLLWGELALGVTGEPGSRTGMVYVGVAGILLGALTRVAQYPTQIRMLYAMASVVLYGLLAYFVWMRLGDETSWILHAVFGTGYAVSALWHPMHEKSICRIPRE